MYTEIDDGGGMETTTARSHRIGDTEFAIRYGSVAFVGNCWSLREYVRGVQVGEPRVYADEKAARRAFNRAVRKAKADQ
jgi:hypothetical protein